MLILIVGLPGSGKSTVAKILAEKLHAIVLNSDVIRRELFPQLRDYSSKETQKVILETKRRTEELLRGGHIVILDTLFTKQGPRNEYRRLAESIGIPFKLVYVVTPEDATKERLQERQSRGDASEATFDYYLDRKPHFELIQGEHFTVTNAGDLQELQLRIKQIVKEI
jgi:uncharacterized protein